MSFKQHDIQPHKNLIADTVSRPNTHKNGLGDYLCPLLNAEGKQEVENSNFTLIKTELESIDNKLDSYAGAGNNNIGEGSVKLQVYNYGRDVSGGNFKPMVVNSSAEQIVALSAVDNAVLDTIATNTANINVNVGDVEVNVADLEALQATTNATLASMLIDTDAIDSSLNTIETQSVFTASRLNNIQNKISANVDGTGDTLGQINSNMLSKITDQEIHLGNIDSHTGSIEGCVETNKVNVNISSGAITGFALETTATAIKNAVELIDNAVDGDYLNVNQNIAGTDVDGNSGNKSAQTQRVCIATDDIPIALVNTKLDTLESSLTSMEGKQDSIVTAVQLIDNAVDGDYLNVNQNIAGTDVDGNSGNKSAQTQRVCIATDDIPIALVNTKLDTLESSLTSMEGKQDSIVTAVQLIDNAVDGNYLNANINIAGGDVDSSSGNLSAKTQRVCIATDDIPIALVNTKLDTLESSLTAMEAKMDTDNVIYDSQLTKLTDAETHLGNIQTAVELLDNCVDTNHLNVNLNIEGGDVDSSSGNLSAKTQRICIATDDIPLALVNTNLVALETSLTAMEVKMDTDNVVYDNILTKITAQEIHIGNIDAGIDVLEACVGSNKVAISGGGNTARLTIATGTSELAHNELVGSVDCSAFSEICVMYPTTQSSNKLRLFVQGSTASGGTYNTFAQMTRKELISETDGSETTTYVWGTGSDQNHAEFIPCLYDHIKIQNVSGTNFADSDAIRIVGK